MQGCARSATLERIYFIYLYNASRYYYQSKAFVGWINCRLLKAHILHILTIQREVASSQHLFNDCSIIFVWMHKLNSNRWLQPYECDLRMHPNPNIYARSIHECCNNKCIRIKYGNFICLHQYITFSTTGFREDMIAHSHTCMLITVEWKTGWKLQNIRNRMQNKQTTSIRQWMIEWK